MGKMVYHLSEYPRLEACYLADFMAYKFLLE